MITIKFRTLVLVTQIELLTEDSELALESTNTNTYIYREKNTKSYIQHLILLFRKVILMAEYDLIFL